MLFCNSVGALTIKCLYLRYNHVFKRLTIIILFTVLAFTKVCAQYDVSFSHYFDMEPSFNPASIGKQAKLSINAAYALNMAGFEHNSRTMYFGGDMPFYFAKAYHGVGAQLVSDQIGLFTHQRVSMQYAYKHSLFDGTISVGLQLGFLSEKFDGSKLDLGESNDPAFPTSNVNGSGVDIALGLYYMHGPWYAGVSGQHMNAPLIKLGEANELQLDRTYYLTGGYNIKLRNPFLSIRPSLLVRTDGVAYRADVTGRLVYTNENKVMYCGIAYSPANSVTFMFGGSFHGIIVGYSYEVYTSAINPGNGSHELFVSYQMDVNLVKKGKNKHKSVRIL